MNRLLLLPALFLISGMLTVPAIAQERWYNAYDEAIKAIQAKQWALAEQKLNTAKKEGPKPGRKVRAYGTHFIDFLPDYYLGLVHFNSGKDSQQKALDSFQVAMKTGQIRRGDPEFGEMTRMIETLNEKMKPKPIPQAPPQETPPQETEVQRQIQLARIALEERQLEDAKKAIQFVKEKDPTNPVLPSLLEHLQRLETEANAKKEAENLVKMAQAAISESNLKKARQLLNSAGKKDPSNPELKKLADRIQKIEQELEQQERDRKEALENALRLSAQKAKTLAEIADCRKTLLEAARTRGVSDEVYQQLSRLLQQKEKELRESFETFIKQGENALLESKYQLARDLAEKARSTMVDTSRSDQLLKRIDVAEGIHTSNALEQQAIMAFYRGQYQASIQNLERIVASKKDTTKTYFYLGCNRVALALLSSGDRRKQLLKKGEEEFSMVRRKDPGFRYDTRFISPRIVQVFERSFNSHQ